MRRPNGSYWNVTVPSAGGVTEAKRFSKPTCVFGATQLRGKPNFSDGPDLASKARLRVLPAVPMQQRPQPCLPSTAALRHPRDRPERDGPRKRPIVPPEHSPARALPQPSVPGYGECGQWYLLAKE